jgi:dTDP-4-dehydrorhamnose reductase
VLVTGAGGMLGTALRLVLAGHPGCVFLQETDLDITDQAGVLRAFASFAASGGRLVVNAAAYTNVEKAEDEPDVAYLVNSEGAGILAAAARELGLDLVHVSTDFVFDGEKKGPYREDDETSPLSVYGASKLAGERAVLRGHPEALVVRTAWVFGPGGTNFPMKILDLANRLRELRVVANEVGSPTYTLDLARGLLALVGAGARGIYHLTGSGSCSRFTLAGEVLRLAGHDVPLLPVTADAFPTNARRPLNSVLDCSKAAALGVALPSWRDGLARFIRETVSDESPTVG